jgi:hypothetical protein
MQFSRLRKRVVTLVRENQMIEHVDSDDLTRLGQPRRQRRIIRTWSRIARRMIVEQDDGGGANGNGFAKHFARMGDRRVERPGRHEFDVHQPVLGVEHDDAELLDGSRTVLRQQIRRQLTRRVQLRPACVGPDQRTASQFDGSEHLRGAGAADAGDVLQVSCSRTRQAVQPAAALEHQVRERQHVVSARPAAKHERQQFVIAKCGRAEALELFARSIVRRYLFHFYTRTLMHVRPSRAWVLALVLLTACGSPPQKEIDQAQDAIATARTDGADRYAADEYNAAVRTLKLAHDAVDEGDYRLALNRAIESREAAQAAARQATQTRSRLRSEIDRANGDVTALLARANEQLAAAEKSRVARRVITDARRTLTAATDDVQKAGAAVEAEDYAAAEKSLADAKQRVAQVLMRLDNSLRAQNARRRR